MKYIPEGPERSLTLGHTRNVPDEKILRLHLTFPQQNEEEQNTLVSTQNNLQIVSNNNENLAIAGPSRNVSIKIYFLLILLTLYFYYIRTNIYYYMIIII
jgi:hypothetical protein